MLTMERVGPRKVLLTCATTRKQPSYKTSMVGTQRFFKNTDLVYIPCGWTALQASCASVQTEIARSFGKSIQPSTKLRNGSLKIEAGAWAYGLRVVATLFEA